ncbi:MAG: ABC transporter permease [bacterium]|nr:ABC transporter permease [bacterium]
MKRNYIKQCAFILISFVILAFLFKWVVGTAFQYRMESEGHYENTAAVGELIEGSIVSQDFSTTLDTIDTISLPLGTYQHSLSGSLTLTLKNKTEQVDYPEISYEVSSVSDGAWNDISLPFEVTEAAGKQFQLEIQGHSPENQAPTLYYDQNSFDKNFTVGANNYIGELSFAVKGKHFYPLYAYYELIVAGIVAVLLLFMLWIYRCLLKGKTNFVLTMLLMWKKYRFLIKQLVGRDFKTKYKRSVLGYLWSFLNPLLTMLVQYVVFSTIFRGDIENFPVYLLAGIVFFSFFQEAVGQGLIAIVGNASLITKVYVPKYIYPITKVWSSSINLLISLIPLLILTLFTGAPVNQTLILLIVPVTCILVFSIGFSLILSTSMVFFRDTQYLWGIISLAWMYATPLFYPITILPERIKSLLRFNPLYHFVTFVRTVLIYGVSPEPALYVQCIGWAFFVLLIGMLIFKRNQDKFVLYI